MGVELTDMFITLTPREQWKRAPTQEELVARCPTSCRDLPGHAASIFTQPIEMRMNEMVAGVRADLGVKLFGDDFDVLKAKAREIEAVLKRDPRRRRRVHRADHRPAGARRSRSTAQAIARYGVPARDVLDLVEALGTQPGRRGARGPAALPARAAPRRTRTAPDADARRRASS